MSADAARRRHRKASGRRSPKPIGRATQANGPPCLVVRIGEIGGRQAA